MKPEQLHQPRGPGFVSGADEGSVHAWVLVRLLQFDASGETGFE